MYLDSVDVMDHPSVCCLFPVFCLISGKGRSGLDLRYPQLWLMPCFRVYNPSLFPYSLLKGWEPVSRSVAEFWGYTWHTLHSGIVQINIDIFSSALLHTTDGHLLDYFDSLRTLSFTF